MAGSILMDPKPTAEGASHESRSWGDLRIRELLAILATIILADVTIYRGQGYTGLAVFFLGV